MKIIINGKSVEAGGCDGVTMEQVQEAVAGKQDKLAGTEGQVVGFDADGNAVAREAAGREVYSTEETRIGTWIDGKPLYRRSVTFTVPASGSVILNFDNAVNSIVHLYGAYHGTNGDVLPISNYFNPSNFVDTSYSKSSGGIAVNYAGRAMIQAKGFLTIEYIKTADTATQASISTQTAQSLQAGTFDIAPTPVTASAAGEISEGVDFMPENCIDSSSDCPLSAVGGDSDAV